MSRDHRNGRVLKVCHIAENLTAQKVTDGVHQLQAERVKAIEDGPDVGDTVGRSNDTTSTTERNATEGYRLGLMLEDLRDAIEGFEIAHRHLLALADEACRTRAFGAKPEPAPEAPVCKNQQHGREGVIEWGDAHCDATPVKAGLCNQHYQAWYRYRKARGINTDRDFAA